MAEDRKHCNKAENSQVDVTAKPNENTKEQYDLQRPRKERMSITVATVIKADLLKKKYIYIYRVSLYTLSPSFSITQGSGKPTQRRKLF